jgi:pseudomonalisin
MALHGVRSVALGGAAALLGAGVAVAAVSGPAASAGAATGASAGSWVATRTRALTPLLLHATNRGALARDTALRIDVGLPVRHSAALAKLAAEESTPGTSEFGHFLTPAEYVSRFAPTQAAVDAVKAYLAKEGFKKIAVDSNRLLVTASGTAAEADAAFDTHLDSFTVGGHRIYANVRGASVPSSLRGDVNTVLGLSDIPMNAVTPLTTPKQPLTGYYPKEFQTVYGAKGTPTGSNTSIAVMAEGDLSSVVSSLRYAEKEQHLPIVPVTVVRTGPASSDTSGADEWDLDTQVSTGMAENVKRLYIYDASTLTDFDIAHEINVFVSQDKAQLGSASIGEPDELAFLDGAMIAIDQSVEEGVAQGQSFFASTGDTGASCAVVDTNGAPDTGLTASLCYPADGTWTTAVGGTTLVTSKDDSYMDELAWNAGGGGVSYFEYPGPWTDTANPASAGGFRGDPDIAMDADLTTGCNVYVGKTVLLVGGTSVASPLAMGSVARVQSALDNRLGAAVLRFYALYNKANPSTGGTKAVPGFHDVIAGTNGLYSAAPGWDYTTGIGSLDVAPLIKALSAKAG